MKNILLPTDFSDNALHAITYALRLYGEEKVQFTLLNIMYIPGMEDNVEASRDDMVVRNAAEQFDKLLQQIQEQFPGNNFNIKTEFRLGTVAGTIADRTHMPSVDLVVMGTQGATGLARKLLGSNTASVIKRANCPVLAVPHQCPLEPPGKILFAVDFDDLLTASTIAPLVDLARQFHSTVQLLHVQQGQQLPGRPEGLEEFFPKIQVQYHTVASENIVKGIAKFSEEHEIQLIAMITHRLNIIDRLLHHSHTRKMAMHTNIPLLALHNWVIHT